MYFFVCLLKEFRHKDVLMLASVKGNSSVEGSMFSLCEVQGSISRTGKKTSNHSGSRPWFLIVFSNEKNWEKWLGLGEDIRYICYDLR